MKRFLIILLTTAALFTFCSCSDRTGQPYGIGESDPQTQSGEQSFLLDNGDPNEKAVDDNNIKEHTWSKDFDGIVLTVTTDKAEYKLGEEINLTSSVKNNTDEMIGIYVGTSNLNSHQEISTWMEHDGKYLFDPDAPRFYNFGTNVIKLAHGMEYVQHERRITFIYKDEYNADEDFEFAPVGEYNCCSGFYSLFEPHYSFNRGKTYCLNYSITLTEPDEPVELYRFTPHEYIGINAGAIGQSASLRAHTEKKVYSPGEPVTVEITLNACNYDAEIISGSCSVYARGASDPWIFEENIIEKRTLPEGIKIKQSEKLEQSFTFECFPEPGEYIIKFSAEYRLPDDSIEYLSNFFTLPISLEEE